MRFLSDGAYYLVRSIYFLLTLVPQRARLFALTWAYRAAVWVIPGYRHTVLKNLELVFPDKSDAWRRSLMYRHCDSMARLLNDLLRVERVDVAWVESHVDFPNRRLMAEHLDPSGKGRLIISGHLGSFDLLARSVLVLGHTTAFVVRNFKHKRIDEWWQRLRGQEGTRVIDRTGAALKMLRLIKSGTDVGVLFDQNVTRKNALFIDHFGRPAATTKSVAYTAVTTQCIVLFISLRYVGNDRYCIDLTEIPVQDVYHDSSLTAEEKMHEITVRATRELERRILAQPEGWFWMHRRWKTTPEGVPEDFYR